MQKQNKIDLPLVQHSKLKTQNSKLRVLALFFTRGISLKTWVDTGLFDREKLLYEAHLRNGNLNKIYWITYGTGDAELARHLKAQGRLYENIHVVPMPKVFHGKWGMFAYSLLNPIIHRKIFRRCHVLKTNQMDGSWSAVIAKWIYKKPSIVRTGYTLSQLEKQLNPQNILENYVYVFVENFAYRYGDCACVASMHNKKYLIEKYRLPTDKIFIIPNFIDTFLFRPTPCKKYDDRIIFVGRLSKAKNLFNLIQAISQTDFTLDIYGKGELQEELEKYALSLNAKVNFKGVVPNHELPVILNKYRYYILPSYFEGMPKTLLEAMACGLVCIGTDVEGINEVITDHGNGYLAKDTDYQSILDVLQKAENKSNEQIIKNAVGKIKNEFSLESVVRNERQLFDRELQADELCS